MSHATRGIVAEAVLFVFILAIALLTNPSARNFAWGQAASAPSFEVASIRLNKSSMPIRQLGPDGDRFNATDTVLGLIEWAYGHEARRLNADQVSGGPQWIRSDWYDIHAKIDDSLVKNIFPHLTFRERFAQTMPMLRSLLAERFGLKVRHELKQLPVYALVVSKNGAKIKEQKCDAVGGFGGRARGQLAFTCEDMKSLAFMLALQRELGQRVVLDQTGLQGRYTFKLEWSPEDPAASSGEFAPSNLPSLFTALQEQLGLKLEPKKAPVDTLVIESIQRPSEN